MGFDPEDTFLDTIHFGAEGDSKYPYKLKHTNLKKMIGYYDRSSMKSCGCNAQLTLEVHPLDSEVEYILKGEHTSKCTKKNAVAKTCKDRMMDDVACMEVMWKKQ